MPCSAVQYLGFIIILALGLILPACASKSKSFGHLSHYHDAELKIAQAQKLHEDGEINSAISVLKILLDNNKYSNLLDPAYLLLITYLLEIQQSQEAKSYAESFFSIKPHSASAKKIRDLFNNYAVFE